MDENSNYIVISTNNDSEAIQNALDVLGLQGFLVATPTSTGEVFECIMYRTEEQSIKFVENPSELERYNYELHKVEYLKDSIEQMLNALGEQGFKIANSWIEGNFVAFILYKVIIDGKEG
ncbi:MAG: hypothetical protein ACPGXZ_14050 [Saprospiraceae bacterium]